MEAMLGISLHSYLYHKLAKMLCLSYYLLCFLFNKTGEQEGGTGSVWKWEEKAEDGPNNVYTSKNDKIKERKYPSQKKGAGGVAQGEGPEFKPLYHKKKRRGKEAYEQKKAV
jgi:hypothetical protein